MFATDRVARDNVHLRCGLARASAQQNSFAGLKTPSGEQYKRSTGATRNLVAICRLVIGVRRDGYVWANLARLRTDPKIFYRFRFGPTRAGGACGRI